MADWIPVGELAPDFTALDDRNHKLTLSSLRGRPVVLYFYPKDDTPGCTKQACSFRDRQSDLESLGASVIGVSGDDVASHEAFRDKYRLNFPLLSDPDHSIAERYGAWREKVQYGKTSIGMVRSTYLLDKQGRVARLWKKVSVDGHDEQVVQALRSLCLG
jgi:peroxiredoxin Q/BCP